MIASFHLVTFRRRRLLPPGRVLGPVEGLRFWKALFTAADPFLSVPSDVSRIRVMKPNLREWGFFGVWEREADLDRFLTGSVVDTWNDESREVWSIRLKPVESRGDWPGIRKLQRFEADELSRSPAAFITRLDIPIRAFGTMWRSAAPGLAPHLPSVPGLVAGVAMMDGFYVHAMTFSLWRSLDDAMTFAYRGAPHQQAVGRLRKVRRDIASKFSSAHFYPYTSHGTWKGANPLVP
jgi:hypothetical protein